MRSCSTSARRKRSTISAISSVIAPWLPTIRHQSAPAPLPLGDREADALERGQVGEKLIDLEGARDAEAHPLVRRERGDVGAVEQTCRRSA